MVSSRFILIGAVIIVILAVVLIFVGNKNVSTPNIQPQEQTEVDYNLKQAVVDVEKEKLDSIFEAFGIIPQNNEKGAVGYGLILENQDNAILVSTSHAGVKDSELQKDESDPVWHNHFVILGESELCGDNPAVKEITFESPGDISVKDNKVVIKNVPSEFIGTNPLTNTEISLRPGTEVKSAVQFQLDPKFDDGQLQAVCVVNIREIPFEIQN